MANIFINSIPWFLKLKLTTLCLLGIYDINQNLKNENLINGGTIKFK